MPSINRNENPSGPTTSFKLLKTWVNTPGFRELVVKGKPLPMNPFEWSSLQARSKHQIVWPPSNFDSSWLKIFSDESLNIRAKLESQGGRVALPLSGVVGDKVEHTLHSRSLIETMVANKLSKKINNRDIDLGVALGEARETAHFIQGAMIGLFTATKRARRGDFGGMLKALGLSANSDPRLQRFRDVPDKIAGAWLGYSYGARPLVKDVLGAAEALEKSWESGKILHYRSSVSQDIDFTLVNSARQKAGWVTFDSDQMLSCKGWQRASDNIAFEIDNPFLYTLSSLGLLNPLSVAHELIRLSFVLDWIIPIGSWVASLVPPQGVKNVRRTVTWKGHCDITGELRYWGYPNVLSARQDLPVQAQNKWKYRTVKSDFPRFNLVGANFDLSREQIASGISLLWTLGASEKSQAKAYNDAVALNSRGIASHAGSLSRESWDHGKTNRKTGLVPKYLFPSDYARV